MSTEHIGSSWMAFGLFYLVLIIIVSVLDWVNGVLTLTYWGMQIGLISLGVVIFAIIGSVMRDLSATKGVLLAFTVGVLTIIPAVLMGLGRIPDLWDDYFLIAFGMAAGSFLSFVFLKLTERFSSEERVERESDYVDKTG